MFPSPATAPHLTSKGTNNSSPPLTAKPRVALANMTNVQKSQDHNEANDGSGHKKPSPRPAKAESLKPSSITAAAPKVGSKLVETTTASSNDDSSMEDDKAQSIQQSSASSAASPASTPTTASPRTDGDNAGLDATKKSSPTPAQQGGATAVVGNDKSATPAGDNRSSQHWNQQGFDPRLLEGAIKAVLTERFGVSDINQLPVADAESLLTGPLPQMVVQHMQRSANATAAQNLKASLPATPRRANALGLTFAGSASPGTPSTPGTKATPFPADALPSEIQLEQNTNLYLNGLEEHITDDELLRIGSQYGEIISHKAIINSETGLCKGYGFIMYARARDAAVAIVELQKKGFQTSFARHESFSAKLRMMSDHRSTNVYISNLPLNMGEEELEALVRPYQIISRRILTKPDGTSRGVGFIRFQSRDIAQNCIDLLHGRRLDGHPHPLQARFADSESQKRLKQDTTLRKIYADLDMGVLRSPSGHNLRPTPIGNAWNSGPSSTHGAAAARYPAAYPNGNGGALPTMGGAISMRHTNSEPGNPRQAMQRITSEQPYRQQQHQQAQMQQQHQHHQPLLRPAGPYGAGVPMSATTSNASFYPGAQFAGTPPTPMSPWVGAGTGITTDTDMASNGAVWTQSGASPVQGVYAGQSNMTPNGWLLPSVMAAGAAGNANTNGGFAGRPGNVVERGRMGAMNNSANTNNVMNRLWSPLLGGDGSLVPGSPSADSGTAGASSAFNSPVFPNEGSFANGNGGKPGHWVTPAWNAMSRMRMGMPADGTDSTALEQKHLGSLLNGDNGGAGNGAEGNNNANSTNNNQDWLQHYALNGDPTVMMYPPELNFVRASGQTAAVPIINPQTGQQFHSSSKPAPMAAGPTRRRRDSVESSEANASSHGPQERGLKDMASKSAPSGLTDMATTPTMASSASAPSALNRQQQEQH